MVDDPWRAEVHVARWNGHPPHTTTGAASTRDSHCQLRNCQAGTIARTTTGRVRATLTSSRRRRAAAPSDPCSWASYASGVGESSGSAEDTGVGTCAV